MKLLLPFLCALASNAATLPMDSARGDQLYQSQGCVQCHQLKGMGGKTAPDLGRVLDRAYTPALLAGTMWNHAPTMWQAMREKNMPVPDLDAQGSAGSFASFYSARYFELPGDAGRGKRLFTSKSCESCHGITTSPNPLAKPVNQWQGLSDPVALVGAMWNHSPDMWAQLSQKKIAWPTMTPQDLSDLLVYLRNSASVKPADSMFRITAGERGQTLFQEKHCVSCHNSQRPAAANLTLTGVAASMWNHATFLHTEPPRLDADEMREVLSEYWAKQFFENSGDVARGKRIFAAKHCAECHTGSGPGPVLPAKGGDYNGITMVSVLWHHGPAMLTQMQQKKIAWPVFKVGEMADLTAWLNESKKKQ
jgi:mono/diheme cytochrome c family protein